MLVMAPLTEDCQKVRERTVLGQNQCMHLNKDLDHGMVWALDTGWRCGLNLDRSAGLDTGWGLSQGPDMDPEDPDMN